MTLITVKLIVFTKGKLFLNYAPICYFVDLLNSRTGDSSHVFSKEELVTLF